MKQRSPYYSYCFVRQDLPGPVQIVQAGHAWWRTSWMTAIRGASSANAQDCNFVLIGVANEGELLRVAHDVEKVGRVPVRPFFEDGPPALGFTAFATEPLTGSKRDYFQKYQTLREKDATDQDDEPSTRDTLQRG